MKLYLIYFRINEMALRAPLIYIPFLGLLDYGLLLHIIFSFVTYLPSQRFHNTLKFCYV